MHLFSFNFLLKFANAILSIKKENITVQVSFSGVFDTFYDRQCMWRKWISFTYLFFSESTPTLRVCWHYEARFKSIKNSTYSI